MLSATVEQIGAALDLEPSVLVSFVGNPDAIGVYENYTVNGLLGLPSGPDGDFLVLSTAHAHDAVRTTDLATRDITTRGRDLGVAGAADDFATVSFTLDVTASTNPQRLLIDFIYASDADTDGGDFFDIIVNGINIAESDLGRIEAGGRYVTNERDPDLPDDAPGFGIEIGTEYSDLLSASYTIPVGVTTLDITITIADSNDAELDAWALIDNVRLEQTQVVFLDFDGEDIGGFFLEGTQYIVPAFDANDFGLGSDFAEVIRTDLATIFADFNIVFATAQPTQEPFMQVVIGGENRDIVTIDDTPANQWLIRELGTDTQFGELFNFLHFRDSAHGTASYGQADRLDLGNEIADDMTVVFAKQISRDGLAYSNLRDSIAHYIGRNLGLRAENNAFINSIMVEDITFRGGQFEAAAHAYFGDAWGDLDALGVTQNAHDVLLDNLGSSVGESNIRNAWTDARTLNQAHWTISHPGARDMHDAHFVIVGDQHTRVVTTIADTWTQEQILVTDFAGQDPRIAITAASRAGGRHTLETLGTRTLGQFTPVVRDAPIITMNMWEHNPSMPRFQGTTTLFQTQVDDSRVIFKSFKFTDDDGDQVTITINTLDGLFTVAETDAGIVITLAETQGARDTLKITVKKKKGGDGRATLGGILGTGIKTLTADKIDFSGTGIDLVQLKKGRFGDLTNGTDFNIRQAEKVKGDYRFREIQGDSHIVAGRHTRKFKADTIEGGASLVFDELDKLESKANLNIARLEVRDGDGARIKVKADLMGGVWNFWDDTLDESLKKLDVKGDVSGLKLTAAGRLFKLKVKGNLDADIEALAVSKVDVKGDWSGSMRLHDDGTVFTQAARKLKVKGKAIGLLFQANNDVNDIHLGAAVDSNFYVGFDFSIVSGIPVDISLLTNPEARVKNVKLKGIKGEQFSMINSVFSSAIFKSLKLGDVNGQNLGVPFGVSAVEIDKIEYDTGMGKVKNKKGDSFIDNDPSDDFFIGRVV